MLLATDLDGTFLGGDPVQRAALYRIINSHKGLQLIFVSGRGLATILPLFEEPLMPKPGFIICDVGATIVNGNSLEPVEPIQSLIEERWPGKKKVAALLAGVKGLTPQDVPQQRRCSYFYNDHTDVDDLKYKVEQLNCDLVLSAGKFADVLPKGINKGYSLQLLAKQYHFTIENILVAGDTFNDLSLFATGYKGVVVGNAEPGLREATADLPAIYHAKEDGAGGILEAMQHFSLLKKPAI
ncbi:HAD-IIB family hydrolase [Agriterribacter sp.]|uniref:HAD-IIB family hydrolase n=1 Tax=Agriterribacter sp. TaxID=2821509 RepID=UPI002D19B23A|nr:HAD-IIB family hydrolase [Agriterribacter sp.]HTN07183.1 HAD-IIB family hydrolase [Agriterribacter sp.]